MSKKLRWGILSTADIAKKRVIPAMKKCEFAEITAISSRTVEKAEAAAKEFGIPKFHGSYEALLGDPEIDVIYNPLPNHLHAEWTVRAASEGKHVLCEKPLGVNTAEARRMLEARDEYGVKIGEAFMVRTHPQWLRTRDLVQGGKLGKIRSASGYFSYYNVDPGDPRNVLEQGGGALLDIGCYPVKTTRMVFGEEPTRVWACIERDPSFKTDRLTSAILEYPSAHCVFTVSTQAVYWQAMEFFGSEARLQVEVPFNPPTDRASRIILDDGKDLHGGTSRVVEEFPICNQFTIQGDLFSRAVLDDTEVPNPLEDSVLNMAVLDALFKSAHSGRWEKPERL